MAIAKMIFNKLNWVPYRNNEKAMVLPKKLTLHSGTRVYERASSSGISFLSREGDTVEVVGEMNDFYLIKGTVGDLTIGGKVFDQNPGAILISEIQNGGGTAQAIYQAPWRFPKGGGLMLDHMISLDPNSEYWYKTEDVTISEG